MKYFIYIYIFHRFLGDVDSFPSSASADSNEEEEELTDSSDPVSFHLKFNQPSSDAISVDKSAVKLLDATERLQVCFRLKEAEVGMLNSGPCQFIRIVSRYASQDGILNSCGA